MRGWWIRAVAPAVMAAAVCPTELAAQAAADTDVCLLATEAEFQKAQGINPAIGSSPGFRS